MKSQHKFPPLPKYKATWAPIYLEPIIQSGERITVGIAAIGADGLVKVIQTVALKQLRCVYGTSGAEAISNITDMSMTALSLHLDKKSSPSALASWAPPMTGLHVGELRKANGNNLDEIISMAMRLSASFADPKDAEQLLLSHIDGGLGREEEQWSSQIKAAVIRSAPQLANHFRRSLKLIEHGRAPFYDYYGSNYVANFGKLSPRRISDALASARTKLWTLGVARDDRRLIRIPHDRYELIVWSPAISTQSAGGHAYSKKEIQEAQEGFAEIEEEARRKDLKARSVGTADEASRHIIKMEIAA